MLMGNQLILLEAVSPLSAAVFLIRDGQVAGERIHILEELSLPGGGMDGIRNERLGYIIRGGREMEPHFEGSYGFISLYPFSGKSEPPILDEFYWLNKKDPSFAKTRHL